MAFNKLEVELKMVFSFRIHLSWFDNDWYESLKK